MRVLEWCAIGKSVRGASHVRAGLPNQDAIRWLPESGSGLPLILAVSDGHGSAKCFRSDVGASFAVDTTVQELHHLLDGRPDLSNLSFIKRTAEERLPQSLVRAWKDAVDNHLRRNPFTHEEWARLVEKESPAARQAVEATPALAYGATILAVLVAESFLLYLQLGDGDILCVDSVGETTRPISRDERLIANETTSLCSPDAWNEIRVRLVPFSQHSPSVILVSTDGYANSFRSEDGFLKVGEDYLRMLRSEGVDLVASTLEKILAEASCSGSGDDITLGIIKRAEDTDVDTLNRRITVLECALDRTKNSENFESTLNGLRNSQERLLRRVDGLQLCLVLVALLALFGIILAVINFVLYAGGPSI